MCVGCGSGGDAGYGHWGSVDLGHEEAAEDNFVEGGVGAACEWECIRRNLLLFKLTKSRARHVRERKR